MPIHEMLMIRNSIYTVYGLVTPTTSTREIPNMPQVQFLGIHVRDPQEFRLEALISYKPSLAPTSRNETNLIQRLLSFLFRFFYRIRGQVMK